MQAPSKSESKQDHDQRAHAADCVTRRLVYALALVPIVPSVAIIGVSLTDTCFGVGQFDELRWFHLFFSILWVGATICIWRRLILWTLGRKWLTALVSMIPFVQVLYGQPLWNIPAAGCQILDFNPEMLRIGQHEIGIGLWVWVAIWVWWGWEKRQMSTEHMHRPRRIIRITPTAKRLAASIGMIPFAVGLFLIVGVALEDSLGLADPGAESLAVTSVIMLAVWILIWRRTVVWSRAVIGRTAITAAVCLALPIAALLLLEGHFTTDFAQVMLYCLPIIGWGVWMAITVSFWPAATTGLSEAGPVPRCMNCGYLLIGLSSTRCPECGDEPTLDELWQATAGAI